MSSFTIRKIKPSEIGEAAKLYKKQNLLHQKFGKMVFAAGKGAGEKWARKTKRELKTKNVFLLVALIGKKIIGYAHGEIRKVPLRRIKEYGFIVDIFVEEKYRGKGAGKALAREMIKIFKSKKLAYIELGVSTKNVRAVNFWKQAGFREYEKVLIRYI